MLIFSKGTALRYILITNSFKDRNILTHYQRESCFAKCFLTSVLWLGDHIGWETPLHWPKAANTLRTSRHKLCWKFWGWIFFGFWSQKDKIWGGKREGRGWQRRGKLPELSSWLMKGRGGGRGGQGWVIRGQQEEEGRADIQLLRRAKANTAVIEMLHFFPLLWVKPFWLQWLAVQIEALPFLLSISGFSGFVYLGILTDSPKVLHWLSGGLSHGRSFKQSSKRQTLEYVYHPSFFSSVHTILSKYVKSWFETKFSACVWYFIYDIWSQNHLLSRSSFFPIPRVQLSWRGAVTILYDCLSVCIGQIDCLKFTPIQNYRHWRAFTVFLRSLLPQGFSYVVWEQSWVGTPRCQCVFEYFKIWSSHKSKTPVQSSLDLSCQAKTSFQSSLVEVCRMRAVAWREGETHRDNLVCWIPQFGQFISKLSWWSTWE